MITIGVISDTHGALDRKAVELFAGVDHILHAGDIGTDSVLRGLERIAPVTAVEGNCDCHLCLGETEVLVLGGFKFVLRHIFDARSPGAEMRELLRLEKPHAIVFGHTHVPCFERWGNVILFNPGYAGRQRFKLPRSVGILRCDEMGTSAQHLEAPLTVLSKSHDSRLFFGELRHLAGAKRNPLTPPLPKGETGGLIQNWWIMPEKSLRL